MDKPKKTNVKNKGVPYKHVTRVEVYLWGKLMGAVARDPSYDAYAFSYAPEFIASGIQPSPLVMPLSEQPYVFPDLPKETYKGLPALLSDALPDDFGNALINRYMADKGISAAQVTALPQKTFQSAQIRAQHRRNDDRQQRHSDCHGLNSRQHRRQ